MADNIVLCNALMDLMDKIDCIRGKIIDDSRGNWGARWACHRSVVENLSYTVFISIVQPRSLRVWDEFKSGLLNEVVKVGEMELSDVMSL